jgi:hypothetical protein
MKSNPLNHTYSITLPSTTTKDIIDWFGYMEENKKLAERLIELVRLDIKNCYYRSDNAIYNPGVDIKKREDLIVTSEDDFINSLYNWQDSNHAIFKDEKQVKPKTKGMLSV